MTKEHEVQGLASLVQEVEQSVKDVEDPQMRLLAFGEILKFLLGHDTRQFSKKSKHNPPKKVKGVTKSRKSGTKGEGTMTWLEELKGEDFFKKPKNTKEILTTLEERGHHLKGSDMTKPLQLLTTRKMLRRKKIEPAEGGKSIWHYSNW